ncbi:hypothetical protein PC128_g8163 [Phytophthora cactorum]|nr:hypothetical protein PC128_g8163 [Phytophthora cactorum]KAG4045219.1 hypothetical protein PC123_g19364 [Phytophthora cactorum]
MCGKPGHLKATCPNKKQKWGEGGDADFVLTVDDSTIKEGVKFTLGLWLGDAVWKTKQEFPDRSVTNRHAMALSHEV